MTAQGIFLIDIFGLILLVVLVHMARTKQLNVGYTVLWVLAVSTTMLLVSVPPLLSLVTSVVGAIFPVSALSLLAFIFIFVILVLFSTVLSRLTHQLEALAHALAITRGEIHANAKSKCGETSHLPGSTDPGS